MRLLVALVAVLAVLATGTGVEAVPSTAPSTSPTSSPTMVNAQQTQAVGGTAFALGLAVSGLCLYV